MPPQSLFFQTRCCMAWLSLFLIPFVAGCQTAPDLSLEEARKISATGKKDLSPPPRAGLPNVDFFPEYLDAFTRKTCKDEPPKPVDIDRAVEALQPYCDGGAYRWEKKYCLPDMLFQLGRGAMNRGDYANAIALIKAALSRDAGGGAERYRPHLAASYAAIGDFSAARWSMGGGNSARYRSISGRYQVKVNYQIGRAAVERLRGNYAVAEVYYRQSLAWCREGLQKSGRWVFYQTETQFLPDLGEVLLMQGRPVEAELVLRESLKRTGSFADGAIPSRLRAMVMLGSLYYEQGRYADAEAMTRAAIGGFHRYDCPCSMLDLNLAHLSLAKVLLDEAVCPKAGSGKAAFAYAHPFFWAPFSLVGEGRSR